MIIGFVGRASSGKSTAGEFLHSNYGFIKESYANSLKDAVATIFNWPRDLLEGDTLKSREWREAKDHRWSEALGYDVTPRLILQKMGTDACRNVFGQNIWVASTFARMDYQHEDYVITDVRFVNEMEAIRKLGGKVVLINRFPDPDWLPYVKEAKQYMKWGKYPESANITSLNQYKSDLPNIHISEWAWVDEPFDYIIDNTHDLLTLDLNLTTMMTHFDYAG